jgi:hypothetical protein
MSEVLPNNPEYLEHPPKEIRGRELLEGPQEQTL